MSTSTIPPGASPPVADELLNAELVASSSQVSSEVADEVTILNLDDGVYYQLDPVGSRIWELLQERRRVVDIRDILVAEYDVTPEVCEQDLLQLLHELLETRLIERVKE